MSFFGETSNFNFGVFVSRGGQVIQVTVAGDVIDGIPLGFADLPQLNNNGDVALTGNPFDGSNAIFVATNGGNNNAEGWGDSPSGAPAQPGQLQWQKTKRNLLQSKDRHNHLGQNVKMVNQGN